MGNLLNGLMAAIAMVLSTVTTYLSFFDDRALLTSAIDDVRPWARSGGGGSEGSWSYSFRHGVEIDVILSLRGARPLVLTEALLVRVDPGAECAASEVAQAPFQFETRILEPKSLTPLALEFPLPGAEATAATKAGLEFEDRADRWCLQLKLFDVSGAASTPMMRAFDARTTYARAPGADYPSVSVALDVSPAPAPMFKSGAIF